MVVTDGRADKIPEAARYAAHFGMPIYAIGLCIDEDHPLRRYAVSYRAADSFDDLAQGLEETLAELPKTSTSPTSKRLTAGSEAPNLVRSLAMVGVNDEAIDPRRPAIPPAARRRRRWSAGISCATASSSGASAAPPTPPAPT